MPFALMSLGVVLVLLTWGRGPDVLIDFGRELYIPWRLTQGDLLYRDLSHLFGPLSVCLNAVAFKLLGVSVARLALINVTLIGTTTVLVFSLFRRLAGPGPAFWACLTFLGLFAFPMYEGGENYNHVTPYAHELTHGLILSLVAIAALSGHLRTGQRMGVRLAALTTGLVFLTKPEVFVALAPTVIVGVVWTRSGETWLGRVPLMAGFLMYAAAPVAVAVLLEGAVAGSVGGVFFPYRAAITMALAPDELYRTVSGFYAPGRNIARMVAIAGAYALFVLGITRLSRSLAHAGREAQWGASVLLWFVGIVFVLILAPAVPWVWVWRGLPAAVLVILILEMHAAWRGSEEDRWRHGTWLMVVVFSLVLMAKISLRTQVYHYGFVLAMPAVTMSVVWVMERVPMRLKREAAGIFRRLIAGTVAVVVCAHLVKTGMVSTMKTVSVGDGEDRMMDWLERGHRGPVLQSTLLRMSRLLGPGEKFVVIPEGVVLNYLLRRESGCRYVNFMPPEIEAFGEREIVQELMRCKPEYVLLVNRETREYGSVSFGADFGPAIARWMMANYRVVEVHGGRPFSGQAFGIALARRNDLPWPQDNGLPHRP
jgi:4-amino-4-deoxy-L-arabinose transferase-like glycosyltransferase